MKILVAGASGATGKLLVEHLLNDGMKVKIIVRASSVIPDVWNSNNNISIIKANIAEITLDEMCTHLKDCSAFASCLGHNLTFKGIYGKPRKLVTNSVKLMCDAIVKNGLEETVKFVLMNTAGNSNRDLNESVSIGQKLVIGLLRLLLPPHPDNEKAADYLRLHVGQNNPFVEWVAVRPDSLIDQDDVSEYELYQSPTRSAIFNPGKTSRINVGHFMAKLISNNEIWNQWKGQMPVIYNAIGSE